MHSLYNNILYKRFYSSTTSDNTGVVVPRIEAIKLYRDALRTSKRFNTVYDKEGKNLGKEIRKSIRMEFEAARYEYDPEIIARLLVTGRQCVMDVIYKIQEKDNPGVDIIRKPELPNPFTQVRGWRVP